MDGSRKEKKVYVGMSGGVDSSVSAGLLKEQGYDVTGVFIRVWQPPWLLCTWREERRDAMHVAARLGIPFKTLNLSSEYKKEVADYMIEEYRNGRTPNPDVMCNKEVKFGGFFEWAMEEGADFVATGHYARIKSKYDSESGIKSYELCVGKDTNKDQSYFLWTLSQKQLANTLFPIGEMKKTEVRKEAERLGLPTADKKDSQGICFLGKLDIRDFLSHYIDVEEGYVLDTNGKKIGTHDGAVFYTIGQRHGFKVDATTTDESPRYIVEKDIKNNTLTVAQDYKELEDLGTKEIKFTDTNWIARTPKDGTYLGRIRYRQQLQPCQLEGDTVAFEKSQFGVAGGQSFVLYQDDECLGGGIIS